ncbi:hypothetical protein MNV49_000458 [Pseudohyphozyma bogoriensis]|nr:hypothetical protein MNV49_000458 [Pseudohyphozyma bogoriensis]
MGYNFRLVTDVNSKAAAVPLGKSISWEKMQAIREEKRVHVVSEGKWVWYEMKEEDGADVFAPVLVVSLEAKVNGSMGDGSGVMTNAGARPGSDRGKTAGMYTMSDPMYEPEAGNDKISMTTYLLCLILFLHDVFKICARGWLYFPSLNVAVNPNKCNGFVDHCFQGWRLPHCTSGSDAFPNYERWGCSAQLSRRFQAAAKKCFDQDGKLIESRWSSAQYNLDRVPSVNRSFTDTERATWMKYQKRELDVNNLPDLPQLVIRDGSAPDGVHAIISRITGDLDALKFEE